MKKLLLGSVAVIALLVANPANAADTENPAPISSHYDWSGFYVGITAGAAWGQYDPRTSTVPDGYLNATNAAAVGAAGSQTIKPPGFSTGIEGGYNWQSGNLLLGVEADLQAIHLNGATNSGAVPYPTAPGLAFVVTSYSNTDWLLTARPRVGFVAPNHWLFYATGGLAVTRLQSDFSFVDNNGAFESGRLNTIKLGYAAGGGIEAPLTDRLSIKAEYLRVDFSNTAGIETASDLTAFPGQVFSHSSDLKADIVRAGLNYRFGDPGGSASRQPIFAAKTATSNTAPPIIKDWEVEAGARMWFSTGRAGAPDPLFNNPPATAPMVSRLVYSDLNAISGEIFARVDHSSGIFVKGFLGAGGINSGSLNDEDFPAGNGYSNTLSSSAGHIGYATIDLGYNIFKAPGAKLGAFVGYNYYAEAINDYGCTQIAAGNGSCPTAPGQPASLLGLTENDHLNSLRIGLSSEVMLTDRLKLTADAAYVPWVSFSGLDDHLLRQLLLPEASNSGDGVMLEAMVDYFIANGWSVGIGGRYWAWNLNTGSETFDFLAPPSTLVEPARFNAERYGVFVQTSYHWGDTSRGVPIVFGTKAPPAIAAGPMNWTGVYIGGHLGGGQSNADWSDPFPTAPSGLGGTNIAGFGDTTRATGPLGGGQIGANWQTGPWVTGILADASSANMRGENTCFSGLGGINCQHVVNALGSIAGRIGYAWDRSLAYVKAGGAWTDTTYNLYGNTNNVTLGAGSTSAVTWGWTLGGGVEYALTNNWTTFAEYDHIGLPSTTTPFPSVAVVNAAAINVRQSVDLFKLGVNYKFDLATLTMAAAGK